MNNVFLECEIDDQESNVTWFKDALQLDYNEKYQLLQNKNLLISKLNLKHDLGVYYCKAENNYGYVFSNNATILADDSCK